MEADEARHAGRTAYRSSATARRVIVDRNPDAHAERVALWDAQRRLGINNMTGAVIYSTSRPCGACQDALALANVERMYFGADGADAGRPRRSR